MIAEDLCHHYMGGPIKIEFSSWAPGMADELPDDLSASGMFPPLRGCLLSRAVVVMTAMTTIFPSSVHTYAALRRS